MRSPRRCDTLPSPKIERCEDELVHQPGAIQPFGTFLAAAASSGIIHHVAGNVAEYSGQSPDELLGTSLSDFAEGLGLLRPGANLRARLAPCGSDNNGRPLRASVVHVGDDIFLELEPAQPPLAAAPVDAIDLAAMVDAMTEAEDLAGLYAAAVGAMRLITGLDRAILYIFDPNWHGQVVAENRRDPCTAYLGLRFPNSDIPSQARELYARTSLRMVANNRYQPVPLFTRDAARCPLDLSYAITRSISPLHLEYMQYLGATASLSVSIMQNNHLFGLLSCTHEQGPQVVVAQNRAACQLVGSVLTALLPAKRNRQKRQKRATRRQMYAQLFQRISDAPHFAKVLCGAHPNMLDLVDADGGAVLFRGTLTQVGRLPSEPELAHLIAWLQRQQTSDSLFDCHDLPTKFPAAEAYKDVACGVMAVSFPDQPSSLVIWFRPEVVQTVDWGGNPNLKTESAPASGVPRPRRSFARWQEAVHLQSNPWTADDRQAAGNLMEAISDVVLRRSEELAQLVDELAQSNEELDAFAYAASHDLKEPLRGIHNFVQLTLRDAEKGDAQPEKFVRRLSTVMSLTDRMEDLINALLHYARVGRSELKREFFAPQQVLTSVAETLETRLSERQARVVIDDSLPQMYGDKVLIGEVLTNLVSNAVKYNKDPEPVVEIGFLAAGKAGVDYFVRDNGIGIAAKHLQVIFSIFRRLHARDHFGGGSGTGLTIAKRVIEKHGGRLWVESALGKGTTFWFNLPGGEGVRP